MPRLISRCPEGTAYASSLRDRKIVDWEFIPRFYHVRGPS
jgi:hypothetical protein